MLHAALMTLIVVGKVHDRTPGENGAIGQDTDEDDEEEEMEEVNGGNGEGKDGGMSTRDENTEGRMSTRAHSTRGGSRGAVREDQGGRRDTSARQNSYADRDRDWRGGSHSIV